MPVTCCGNGGIGTYVKSRNESNAEVGDRTNDAVRINGMELKAKVVGEGGNLGFFAARPGRVRPRRRPPQHGFHRQLGRGQHLGRRSHIKILLNPLVQIGKLTRGDRNKLLWHDERGCRPRHA